MAMPAQPTGWTVEVVRALPDDGNCPTVAQPPAWEP